MKSPFKNYIYLAVALTILASAGSIWLSHEIVAIDITDDTNQKHIFRHLFKPGDSFAFKYIHSVQKTPVWEYYTIDSGGQIVLTATKVKSVGYGMPKPEHGDSYAFKDGFFIVNNLNQPIKVLLIRNTFIRPMTIFCADKVLKLQELANKGDLIRISGFRTSRIGFYWNHLEKYYGKKRCTN